MPKKAKAKPPQRSRKRPQSTIAPVVLRWRDACAFVGLKPTQFSKYVKLGLLPQPITLTDSGRAKAWIVTELQAWQAERVAKRDGRAAER